MCPLILKTLILPEGRSTGPLVATVHRHGLTPLHEQEEE